MNVRQLARLAQLSPSAVSLALRDSPKISADTKKRVRDLAEQLGYRPDARLISLMRHLRRPQATRQQACFGVISFYDELRPWERSLHLSRIYRGMHERASALGYRLEPLWLREPGMTLRRFREILDARGIEGLLCFGSPNVDQDFPAELGQRAVVTVGLSLRTRLHRVTSHFYNDTVHALNRVHGLGYRRPGIIVGRYEEERSGHAYSSAYLGWCAHRLGIGSALPVLAVEGAESGAVHAWLTENRPDVVLFVHRYEMLPQFHEALRRQSRRVPEDLGVAVLSQILDGSEFSGLEQNQALMGGWAVELLVSRVTHRDFGIPANPRTELVESQWVEKRSLRIMVNR